MSVTRRDFFKFVGTAATLASAFSGFTSCNKQSKLFGMSPSDLDQLQMAKGLHYDLLIGYGDHISTADYFGYNNDYIATIALSENRSLMWVNHEYPNPLFVSGYEKGKKRTKAQIEKEMYVLGGSIFEIEKVQNKWRVVKDSQFNKRLTASTSIPFAGDISIQGKKSAIGTFANCAGGVTPWNTILTCEENYHDYYGEVFSDGSRDESFFGWEEFYPENHPHHYGWVVEVDLKTAEAKKLTSLGRYAHECCTVTKAHDGTIVAYSGDDKAGEFIYKFISSKKDSLEEGELFVADIINGKWLSLDINKNEVLKKKFKTQLDVLIHCREAGKLIGATPNDRPEDFEIHPETGEIFICLTNNYSKNGDESKNNYHGKILKISHPGGNHLSSNFSTTDFVVGGEESGLSCPDNLAFDKLGNLWVTNDISGSMMNKGPYKKFKNNGLFYIPLTGKDAGKPIQLISAPNDAELTGLTFSSDNKTLFLSVQHPGEKSKSIDKLTSNWPDGGNEIPRPCVVQIQGELLESLLS